MHGTTVKRKKEKKKSGIYLDGGCRREKGSKKELEMEVCVKC
jgi:hypothetical protein